MRKVWKEIDSGREWIVDGDLQDFFGSVDHEKLLTLLSQRVADSRVLRLIKAMLKAGSYGQGKLFPSERGTPQGGVASPLLSNILLTPFDQEMRRRGYQLTRFADDWVITCKSVAEARAALAAATRILGQLGVRLNPQKTRIVHIQQGFDFLGYRIVRTRGKSKLSRGMIQRWNPKGLIAYPTRKSIQRFRNRVRMLTRRSAQRPCAPNRSMAQVDCAGPLQLLRGTGQHRQPRRIPGSANWALVEYTSPPKPETPDFLDTYARSG
jgi:group II intron reverse transcriptase/maturase